MAYPMMLCVCLCVSDVTVLWATALTLLRYFHCIYRLNIRGSTASLNIEVHRAISHACYKQFNITVLALGS